MRTVLVTRHDVESAALRYLAGGDSVVLHGPSGMGKSHVLHKLVAAARGCGKTVLLATTAPAEREVPFSLLADLFDSIPDTEFGALRPPQRTALLGALGRQAQCECSDPLALRLAVLNLLRRLADRDHVLLALDGACHIDEPSASVLAYAARRLVDSRVRAVVTVTPGPARRAGRATESCPGKARVLFLPPADLPELREMAQGDTERRLPDWLLRAVHTASAGNVADALEMVRLLHEGAALPGRGELLPVPERVRHSLAARLEGTGPQVRALLQTAACAQCPDVTLLHAAAQDILRQHSAGRPWLSRRSDGPPASDDSDRAAPSGETRTTQDDAAAHALVAGALLSGVLEMDDDQDRVHFTQPLFAHALYAAAGPTGRRTAHARLCAVLPSGWERTRQRALATTGPDEELAEALMKAAQQAAQEGAPGTATELIRLAVARTPDRLAGPRCDRLLAGADQALTAADHELCRELATASLHIADTPARHVKGRMLLIAAADQAMSGMGHVFAEAFAHLHNAPHDQPYLHYLRACKAHMADGDPVLAWSEAEQAVALARQSGDRSTEALSLSLQAFVGTLRGEHEAADVLLDQGLSLSVSVRAGQAHLAPDAVRARLDFFADRLVDADARLTVLLDRARAADDAQDTLYLLCSAAETDVRAGRCHRALKFAGEALDLARRLGIGLEHACYSAAVAEAAGGDLGRAAALAEESARISRRKGDLVYLPLALGQLGHVQLRLGDAPAAAASLDSARTIARRRGIIDPAPVPWAGELVEALTAAGERTRARHMAESERENASRLGRWGVCASLLRAEALLLAESADYDGAVAALQHAAERHEVLALPLERGRDLLALGTVRQRRRHITAALASWRDAAAVFREIQAEPWLSRTHAQMTRFTHAVNPEGHEAGTAARWKALTEGERRVSALARTGATNREIASRLVLSAKTVEATLTRAYRKLGVRSRTELLGLDVDEGRGPTA
ncbi:AAA family ATPase [Streptomyces sp. NPDC047017]|uniref:AAA family ATPase n=1 Tax=Streptomyces sp. NPDC047017 TaxID=3155024 RepID=UPI0033F39498